MPLRGLYLNFTMTENSKLSKNDLKWIKFNQKMAAMSGKKKLKKKDLVPSPMWDPEKFCSMDWTITVNLQKWED